VDSPSRTPSAWGTLLTGAIGQQSVLSKTAALLPTFEPPWEHLARLSGWVVWLGHPPAPPFSDPPLLPAPSELLWDAPATSLATVAGLSLRYAQRRGAVTRAAIQRLLLREGPIAVIIPDEPHPSLCPALNEIAGLGIPLVPGTDALDVRLASIPSFAARLRGHAAPIARPHDPSLAFQSIAPVDTIGANPLSSFVLHHEGERDGISVTGEPSQRLGLEIGVRGPALGLAETIGLEASAATYPPFLDGVTSRLEGHSLEIGWAGKAKPDPPAIGHVLRAWLMALDVVDLVDVRLVFAPPTGRSAVLTDMRARAAAFREYRAEALRDTTPG